MSRKHKSVKPKAKKVNRQPAGPEPAASCKPIDEPQSEAPDLNAPNGERAKKWPLYSESGKLNVDRLAEVAAEHHPAHDPLDIDRLARVFGTLDRDFIGSFIQQLMAAGRSLNFNALSFMMAVIKDVKPRDQLEAMLVAQTAATHIITMILMQRFVGAENLAQQQFAERSYVKLARTYTSQMETLKRYRTGGEQKVTVQHLQQTLVREGSQAIVGNVTHAARDPALEKPAHSTAALPDAQAAGKSIFELTDRELADLRLREEADLKLREDAELRRMEEEDGLYKDIDDAP